MGDGALVK